jgi:cyclophilin family peptidyl-prolyl cis-trans isomerase
MSIRLTAPWRRCVGLPLYVPLHSIGYKGATFHRIIKDLALQAGFVLSRVRC